MVTLLQIAQQGAGLGSPTPPNSTRSSLDVLYAVGMVIVLVLLLGMVVLKLRKNMLAADAPATTPASAFEELRAMKKRGEISEAEFETMRRRLVEKVSGRSGAALSVPGTGGAGPMNSVRGVAATGSKADPTARHAAPGFDLTGAPLPAPLNPPDPNRRE